MPASGYKSIAITDEMYDKLNTLRHPGQSYSGVIQELLNSYNSEALILSDITIQKLESYRDHPKETIEDLVNAVINELENNIGGK